MDYSPLFAGLTEMFKSMDGNQPGEPRKGIERMIDVVRQEGVAKGKEIPVCLPLGYVKRPFFVPYFMAYLVRLVI